MPYRIEFKRSAAKEFESLEPGIKARLVDLLRLLAVSPFSTSLDIKQLKGAASLYRARLGDYRVVYEVQKTVLLVVIVKIGHRREVYR